LIEERCLTPVPAGSPYHGPDEKERDSLSLRIISGTVSLRFTCRLARIV
jgi:hypothetical protein